MLEIEEMARIVKRVVSALLAKGWRREGDAMVAPAGSLTVAVGELADEELLAKMERRLVRVAAAAQTCAPAEFAAVYRDTETLVVTLKKGLAREHLLRGNAGENRWEIAIRGGRVFLDVWAPDGKVVVHNEVYVDQYFTEERRGGAVNLQDDVRDHAPGAVAELEELLAALLGQGR